MGFWDWLTDLTADHTREELRLKLASLDAQAHLMPRGVPEERAISEQGAKSLGAIAVNAGPIRWVNLLNDGGESGDLYYAAYGVPDARLATIDLSQLTIKSFKVRAVPFVGTVRHVRWKGNERGLGIIAALNDQGVGDPGLITSQDVIIKAHTNPACWTMTISIRISNNLFGWIAPPRFIPTADEWACYRMVAERLLGTPVP